MARKDIVIQSLVASLLVLTLVHAPVHAMDEPDISKPYTATVDHKLALNQMIEAGGYDWTDFGDISGLEAKIKGSGAQRIEIILVHYNKDMPIDAALIDLDKRGLRPAKFEELLALGAAKPVLQREYPIVALGVAWHNLFNLRFYPVLDGDGHGGRCLRLIQAGYIWSKNYRFAAVRQ